MEIIDFIIKILKVIISIVSWPVKKIRTIMKTKDIKVRQSSESMENTEGLDVELTEGEKVKLENVDIEQRAKTMRNVTGMKIKASGHQEAEIKNTKIKSPIGTVEISKDVTINKQSDKK